MTMKNRFGDDMHYLGVRIAAEDWKKLQALANQERCFVTDIVRKLIRQRIEHL